MVLIEAAGFDWRGQIEYECLLLSGHGETPILKEPNGSYATIAECDDDW